MIKVGNFIVGSLVMSIFGLLVANCSGNSKGNDKDTASAPVQEVNRNLRFVSYSYDMIARYTGSDTVPAPNSRYIHYSGEGILPEALGDDSSRTLRDTLEKIARVHFADKDTPEPILGDSIELTNLSPANVDACSSGDSQLSVSLVNPRIAVFDVVTETYDCMAAHGMTNEQVVNYDINHGGIMNLQDLIVPHGETSVTLLLRDNLKLMDIPLLDDLEQVQLSKTFSITSDGLLFIYQPYEIAPYSQGIVRVLVPLGDLMEQNLLTDHGRYAFFGTQQ